MVKCPLLEKRVVQLSNWLANSLQTRLADLHWTQVNSSDYAWTRLLHCIVYFVSLLTLTSTILPFRQYDSTYYSSIVPPILFFNSNNLAHWAQTTHLHLDSAQFCGMRLSDCRCSKTATTTYPLLPVILLLLITLHVTETQADKVDRCCRSHGVPDVCVQKLCYPLRPPGDFDVYDIFNTKNNCTKFLPEIAQCLGKQTEFLRDQLFVRHKQKFVLIL